MCRPQDPLTVGAQLRDCEFSLRLRSWVSQSLARSLDELLLLLLLLLGARFTGSEVADGISMEKSVLLGLGVLALAWVLWTIYRFATADGDLALMSKSAPPPGAWNDKVVWITGASQGIGEELALEFIRLGAKLILSARRVSELERVKATLHADDRVVIVPFDVTGPEETIKEAVDKAERAFGGQGVDVMVQNAAYPRSKQSATDIPEEETQKSFAVNVLGCIASTKFIGRKMMERKRGHFLVLSSAAGKIPSPAQSVYSGTKFAVQGYFSAVRNEMGNAGIKVTLVCPGPFGVGHTNIDKERQPLRKVVDLTMIAAYHQLEEAWIMTQPLLTLCYLAQYCPSFASKVLQQIGHKRMKRGGTYSFLKLIKRGD